MKMEKKLGHSSMKIILNNYKFIEKVFKIKFLKPEIKIHKNGFISVVVDWSTRNCEEGESSKFKYVELAYTSSGGQIFLRTNKKPFYNVRTASFDFEDLKDHLSKQPPFDVTIASENEEDDYDYLFFHNTKYGIICWFAPKGWEDWNNAYEFKQ
jgi:hypothetical protein